MGGRVVRALLLMSLAAAAGACRGDEPEEEQGSAGFVLPGEEAYVSPEDSARAEEDNRARAEALRDSLRRAAGDRRGEDEERPAPALAESPEARYAACMAQANQADAEMRGRLTAACENIRAQASTDVPAP
jgi:hypothetical protein